MRHWLPFLLGAFLATPCRAIDDAETERFVAACCGSPIAYDEEMSDVVLVNAYLTDPRAVAAMANGLCQDLLSRPGAPWGSNILQTAFSSITKDNATIQMFRERIHGIYYRLDTAVDLPEFKPYPWETGGGTNGTPFFETEICVAPHDETPEWTLYDMIPSQGVLAIAKSRAPRTDYYLHLHSLSARLAMNILMRTADFPGNEPDSRHLSPGSPYSSELADLRFNRAKFLAAFGANGSLKGWGVRSLEPPAPGVRQFCVADANGVEKDELRVVFNERDPKRRYLAYLRDLKGGLASLCAWDYNDAGSPVRFLRVEMDPNAGPKAWAQIVLRAAKATHPDLSIFNVDSNAFTSVYDKRPEYPIQTRSGEVVFDARTDKFAPDPASRRVGSPWTTGGVDRRLVAGMALLLLALVVTRAIQRSSRKRPSRDSRMP